MSVKQPVGKTHEGYSAHYSTLLHLQKSLENNSITIDGSNGSGQVGSCRPDSTHYVKRVSWVVSGDP
jgi:hypothetical protein